MNSLPIASPHLVLSGLRYSLNDVGRLPLLATNHPSRDTFDGQASPWPAVGATSAYSPSFVVARQPTHLPRRLRRGRIRGDRVYVTAEPGARGPVIAAEAGTGAGGGDTPSAPRPKHAQS
jgi:hypothetical protein